jgi:hypothetical protein
LDSILSLRPRRTVSSRVFARKYGSEVRAGVSQTMKRFCYIKRGRYARTSADRYGPLGVVFWGRRRKQVGGKIVPAQPSIP